MLVVPVMQTLIFGYAIQTQIGDLPTVVYDLDGRSGSRELAMAPWDRRFTLDATHGQPFSYWAGTHTPDGMVHLSDSRLIYSFNLAWLLGS